ncbi:TetR/AcrR family transcriptional regulator [Streptomyces sp. NPDC048590]|uniref:TetR/AcrR family transcriptional regulator n=1 Tax=Streptomyces sp. NPDC048590 TaxID=3365574 RepID=UPI00371BAE9F
MPKRVDHEERRRQIAAALVQVAGRRGLHAVGMREVAAEAGVSLRLVQYYFETKEKLLLFGLQYLAARLVERVTAKLREAGEGAGPRRTTEALLLASLPTDEESRIFHLVYTSYAVLTVTDEALAAQPFRDDPDAAEQTITALIRQAQQDGDARPGLDAHAEAVGLLAMSAGMGISVLVGQRDAASAEALLGHHLDRIFVRRPS